MNYQQVYDDGQFQDIISSNGSVPTWVERDEVVERLLQHAHARADSRGEDSALDSGEADCFIATDWASFTEDWGFSGGDANQVAIGTLNEEASAGKDATLFTDVAIIQTDWLRSGDGRKTQAEQYVDEGWDDATAGDMWIPNGAQEYICIKELTGELLHGEPSLTDAM